MEMRGQGPYRICALLCASIAPGFPDPVSMTVPLALSSVFPRLQRRPPLRLPSGSRTPEELILHQHCRRRPSVRLQREPCSAPSSSRRPRPPAPSCSPAGHNGAARERHPGSGERKPASAVQPEYSWGPVEVCSTGEMFHAKYEMPRYLLYLDCYTAYPSPTLTKADDGVSRYPPTLAEAEAPVAGRDSHPQDESAFPQRTWNFDWKQFGGSAVLILRRNRFAT